MEEERELLTTDVTLMEGPGTTNKTSINGLSTHTQESSIEQDNGQASMSRTRLVVILAACFYLMFCSSGVFVALGVIYVELIEYYDSPRSQAALVQSVFNGFAIGGGIFFTGLVLKFEAGLVVVCSSLVAAASFCASALSPNISVVILLIGVVTGLAGSINILVGHVVVGWAFQKRRKAAWSVILFGSALSQICMPYIALKLVDRYLWQGAALILGALSFLNGVPCGLVIYYSRHYFQKGDAERLKKSKLMDVKCLTDGAFIVFLMSHIGLITFIGLEQEFIVDLAVVKGMSIESGAALLSLHGLVIVVSRVISMVWLGLAPDTRLEWHLIYIFLALAVSRMVISESMVFWTMLLGIIPKGIFGGFAFAFEPGLMVDMRGLELFPQTMALSNFLGGAAAVLGGFVGGLSYDITQSYSAIFFSAAGINVVNAISMVSIILILRYRRKTINDYTKLNS